LRGFGPDSEANFAATVETLNGDAGEDGRRSGEVIVRAISNDESIKARIFLSADEYKIADEAHMTNALVSFSGVLQRQRRLNIIKNVSNFSLVGERNHSSNSPEPNDLV
jgi:hypothetical protein